MRIVLVGGVEYVERDLHCGSCHSRMELRNRSGKGTRLAYYCTSQSCRGLLGAHDDGRPMGIPGDDRTRRERVETHELFDRIWRSKIMTRSEAYAWGAWAMEVAELHIGELDVAGCRRLKAAVVRDFPDLCPLLSMM